MLSRVFIHAVLVGVCCIDSIVATVGKLTTDCEQRAKPPQRAICNTRGRIAHSRLYSPGKKDLGAKFVSNQQECLDLCLKRSLTQSPFGYSLPYPCISVGFNETSNLCLPSVHPMRGREKVGKFIADPASDTIFWTSTCFQCSNPCPYQPVSFAEIDSGNDTANLLDNGSFDDSADIAFSGPWFFDTKDYARQELVPRPVNSTSTRALFVHPKSVFPTLPGQAFQACKGQLYLLKFDWKLPIDIEHGSSLSLVGYKYDYAYSWTFNAASNPDHADPLTGHWVTSEISFLEDYPGEVNEFASPAAIYIYEGSTGRFLLDNVGLYPLASPIQTDPQTELVKNGGFETGNLSNWKTSQDSSGTKPKVVSSNNQMGANFSSYAVEFPGQDEEDSYASILQNITAIPNTRYVLSANYTPYSTNTLSYLAFYISSAYGTEYQWHQQMNESSESITFENVFRAVHEEYALKVEMNVYGYCRVYVDNISIREVA